MNAGEARRLVIEASHALSAAGQADMVWGHVAVRDPEGRGIWIKAPGWGWEELEETYEQRLQLVSYEAEVLQGTGAPHKECHIHLELLKATPDLICTVHTHAVSAIAFASLGHQLRPISHEGALFAGEDVPRFRSTGGLVSTPALGKALAAELGNAPAALMPRHGLVAAGTSVPAAVMHAVLLERACAVQLKAMAAGEIRVQSSRTEAMGKRAECWPDSQLEAGYRYLVRRSARPLPGC
ncbi:class II aldolase/adducin family protein [Streptomyces hygroscopicus]|uniref:class II aldolase/adducin family protein n=1 Tax=Streptomyces hygroscopicus TaxID=1912 RepID=UPI0008303C7D|nr:class II aldolase/adducin family protein [Streptomyces hygroscopicus]GLV75760.1 class II aldolase [Streptomyces hygroscopicus subsp. hygroscopicus]